MKRSGFTMVELLIVMTILAFLMSIAFVVYADSVERARIQSTMSTIRIIKEAQETLLGVRRESIVKTKAAAFKSAYDAVRFDSMLPKNNPPICPTDSAELVMRRLMLRELLPQRLEDLFGLDGTQGTADDAFLLTRWLAKTSGVLRPTTHTHESESSELLYLALTQGPNSEIAAMMIEPIQDKHIADTDGDGLLEFIDDWGHPLRFYTAPTRLFRPGGYGQNINQSLYRATAELMEPLPVPSAPSPYPRDQYNHPINQDPDDFTGAFDIIQQGSGLMLATYRIGTTINQPVDENSFWTNDTHWHPMIVSAGPDEEIGLVEPTGWDVITGSIDAPRRNGEPLGYRDPSRIDELTDNISSGNIK